MLVPMQIQKFASQFNIPLDKSDRKFYKKFCYKLSIIAPARTNMWGASDFSIKTHNYGLWRQILDLAYNTDEIKSENKVRREANTLSYFDNDINSIEKIYTLAKAFDTNNNISFRLYYIDSAVPRNVRLRQKRLPHNRYNYEIILKHTFSKPQLANFIENYGDAYLPNKNLTRAMNNERYYYQDRCGLYTESQEYLNLFTISFGEGIKDIIIYKVLEQ